MEFEWEVIYESEDKITQTCRAKVLAGWIIKDFNCVYTDSQITLDRRYQLAESMVFIPDRNHEWAIDES